MRKPALSFLQHPLAREITLAIVIKLLVIVAIFYAFFDGRGVPTDTDSVADRLASPHSTQPHYPSGSTHAD